MSVETDFLNYTRVAADSAYDPGRATLEGRTDPAEGHVLSL